MIYLNNAATTYPKPASVREKICQMLDNPPATVFRGGISNNDENPIDSTRKALACLFNVKDPNRIVFTSGSTEALNLAIKGLDLIGKQVVATSTEHNSVLRPLYALQALGIITLDIVHGDETGYVDPEKIAQAINSTTGLVVVNHCSNVTGAVQDIAAISRIVENSNAKLLVDASQSAGYIDIDLENNPIDLLAFTGHKSLYGVAGTGGLYVREGTKLSPLKTGGTGSFSYMLTQPEQMPTYFEAGTQNALGIAALGEGVNFIQNESLPNIRLHKQKLMQMAYDALSQNSKIKIYRNTAQDSFGIFCFNIESLAPDDVSYILESSYNIKTRAGLHCCPLIHKDLGTLEGGTCRMSPSYFSTTEEIEIFIDAIEKILTI